MTNKRCANCGEINSTASRFCSNCGFSEFNEVRTELQDPLADDAESTRSAAVIISGARIIVASFLSLGLYFFYWLYITWKHMASEIEGDNHPFWHAMTLNVPVYGFFRMHAHIRTINELAARQSVAPTIAPGLAVLLLVLSTVLNFVSFGIANTAAIILITLISTTLITVPMTMAQRVLNLYWGRALSPGIVRYARIGVGELIIVIFGIIGWILLLIPRSVFEQAEASF
ncbi:MAG: hypothetical protein CL879_01865 [Dehalococcoidia bacterium]|nr:hypothetical protein [Dehalococcoidia bacterium]